MSGEQISAGTNTKIGKPALEVAKINPADMTQLAKIGLEFGFSAKATEIETKTV